MPSASWARARAVLARASVTDSAAAELAFYLALSIVPFIAISLALVGRWVPYDLGAGLEDVLHGVLPLGARVDAEELLRWARLSFSQGWLQGGFLLALWTSFRFMSLCIRALGTSATEAPAVDESFVRSTARSLLLLMVWATAFVAMPIFLLLGPFLEIALAHRPGLEQSTLALLSLLRTPLTAGVLFGAIFLTYKVVAARRVAASRITLAALAATLGWILVSLGFTRTVTLLWSTAQSFETLGSIVLFLLWAYVNSWILLLGGFLLVPSARTRRAEALPGA